MMDFFKKNSFSLTLAFALSACGGGSNDNDHEEAPSVPVLQTSGSLTVSPYKQGKPLSFSQIQSAPSSVTEYYQDLKLTLATLPAYVLFSLNGYTIGQGDNVADVRPEFATEYTEYISPDGKIYTYKEFAAGTHDQLNKLIALGTYYNGVFSPETIKVAHTKTAHHEFCHGVEAQAGNLSFKKPALDAYTKDIAASRYNGTLDKIPAYYRMTTESGMQTNMDRASQEVFAELCSFVLTDPAFSKDDYYQFISQTRHHFPTYMKYVQDNLAVLDQKYKGVSYSFNIYGAQGDTTIALPASGVKSTQFAQLGF